MINTYPYFHKAYRYFLIAISLAIISFSPLLQASPVNNNEEAARSDTAPATNEQRLARLMNKANTDGEVNVSKRQYLR